MNLIKTIKHWLHRMLYIGINDQNVDEHKYILVQNWICFIALQLALVQIIIAIATLHTPYAVQIGTAQISQPVLSLIGNIVFAMIYILGFIMQYRGHHIRVRILGVMFGSMHILFFSIVFGKETGIFNYFFLMLAMPFIVFSPYQRSIMIRVVFIPIICILCLVFLYSFELVIPAKLGYYWALFIINTTCMIIFFYIVMYYFYKVASKSEIELQQANANLKKSNKELQEKEKRIATELELAKNFQQNILSKVEKIHSVHFNIAYLPMSEVGGDIYDITSMPNQTIRIMLADATGHGVNAALVTMLIKSEYDKIKHIDHEPNKVLEKLNELFYTNYAGHVLLFTCFVMDIDIQTKSITYASAGHPTQYALLDQGVIAFPSTGKMIGVLPKLLVRNNEYSYTQYMQCLLFTDGLYEEFNAKDEEYGEEQIIRLIHANSTLDASQLMNLILEDVFVYLDTAQQQDDITVIAVSI